MGANVTYTVTTRPEYVKPYRTNWLIVAMLVAYWRSVYVVETRITHTPSGKYAIIE
jgi:hypothetical protein